MVPFMFCICALAPIRLPNFYGVLKLQYKLFNVVVS